MVTRFMSTVEVCRLKAVRVWLCVVKAVMRFNWLMSLNVQRFDCCTSILNTAKTRYIQKHAYCSNVMCKSS